MIGSGTRLFALLGRPVGHSLSPVMQNAAFRAVGIDAAYLALDCASELVGPLMRGIAASGGGGNVTIPHKRTAALAIADPDADPDAVCNTFWQSGDQVRGANTDPDGVLAGLARLDVGAGRWLVVGTGGSSRGVLVAAARVGASVAVQSRSAERAAEWLGMAERLGVGPAVPMECTVIINATPLGLRRTDAVPVSLADHPSARSVLDLVYCRGETALVRAARAMGLTAADGREVLLGQGVESFRRWFPGIDPPVEVMRAALRECLD